MDTYYVVFNVNIPVGLIRQVTPGVYTANFTTGYVGCGNCTSTSLDGCKKFVQQFIPGATFEKHS